MEKYRIKQVTEIFNINSDAVHSYIRKALPESMKPKKTMQEGLGRETYEFTVVNRNVLKRAIDLKATGLTYKEVKEALTEATKVKDVNQEALEETNGIDESEEIMGTDLTVINQGGKLLADSRDVAEMVDKKHSHLLRDIRNYESHFSTNPVLDSLDFFLPNEYQDAKGEKRESYLISKKGCEFIANKLTGTKGTQFTAIYINTFNKMEKALQQVYHVSETAIVNNVMGAIEDRIFTGIDERLAKYEQNYRPTHANKISVNNYIKNRLGDDAEHGEVGMVKERVLLMLNAQAWQDIPYEKLLNSMKLIDESILATMKFRRKSQISLFEQAN